MQKIPSEFAQKRTLRIFKNFGFLTAGKVAGDFFTFLLFVVLSRAFGQEGIGIYSFAVAFTGFFVVFVDFGLYHFAVKEMGKYPESLQDYYGAFFLLRLILGIFVLTILSLTVPFLSFSTETKWVIFFIGSYQILYTLVDILAAAFVSREDMHLAGLLGFSLRLVSSLASIIVVYHVGSLVAAIAVLPIVTFAQIFLAFYLVRRKYGKPHLDFSWTRLKSLLSSATPYGLSELLRQLSTRVDVVILGFFLGAAPAGVYNVGYRVIFLIQFIPYFGAIALFPLASRLFLESRDGFEALYHRSLGIIVLLGVPASAGLWLISSDLIGLIFGVEFAESVPVLQLLAWLIFILGLKFIMQIFMMSCDRQVQMMRSQWISAWVNVLGNLTLIPLVGVLGAAIATLVSETVLIILYMIRLKDVLSWPRISSRLAIAIIGTVAFAIPLSVFPFLPLVAMIPIAGLIYVGTLFLFKEIRNSEFQLIFDML
jgi:O-antigen/teichoic acid export membrane protein